MVGERSADPVGPEAPATLADRFDTALSRFDELRERPAVVAAVLALAAAALAVGWWWRERPVEVIEATIPFASSTAPADASSPVASSAITPAPLSTTSTTAGTAIVHVAGAVIRPGVVRLDTTNRIEDAVAAAGGPRPDGDPHQLNLAAPVVDGMRIVVPVIGESAPHPTGLAANPSGPASPASQTTSAVIDVNQADAAGLESLPGIGPALAAAIIEHRTTVGPFSSVEELVTVSGIGPATLARLDGRVVAS